MNDVYEHIPCNLCGADAPVTIYPGARKAEDVTDPNVFRSSGDESLQEPLVKCAECGFQYVTPRINARIALDSYANSADPTFASQAASREKTFKKCLQSVQKVWKGPPGGILDIGTANGSFLKVAKDAGWDVAGCEPNRWLGKWCEENYGIRVTPGTIFDGNYEPESFDVITLWDVLEHTPDPMATLKECVRILRPDGLLAVNVPDIGSWIARLMGRKWVFLASVHYFYFTQKTVRQMLEKNGLGILQMKPHIQTLELDYILNRTIPVLGPIGAGIRRICQALGLARLQTPYWIGQTLVIARMKRQQD